MEKKNKHGSIFKKLREERGYKSKDVAGDVISTRTLTRFEADETSLPIATFEKLLENCDVLPIDYLAYYNNCIEDENTEFSRRMDKYLKSGFTAKVINECKRELKKKEIDFVRRIYILLFMIILNHRDDSEFFDENKRIIKEKIESTNKLGCYELGLLAILIDISSREDFTVVYIDRIIEECIHNISTIDYLSNYISFAYCGLLLALLKFLSRNGYYSIGEKRCKEVLNYLEKHPLLFNYEHFYFKIIGLLAMIYLHQNKIEGVELANKMLKYKNVEVEIIDDPSVKVMADIDYKVLCKANKTGIDFEF